MPRCKDRNRVVRRAAPALALACAAALLSSCASVRATRADRRPDAPTPAPAAAVPAPAPAAPVAPAPTPSAPAEAKAPASISAEDLGLYRPMKQARAAPAADELAVVASAKELLGLPPNAKTVVNGKQFTLDCIGTVCAIYYRLGIDLSKDFDKYPGNGVNRLYMSLDARGVLHRDRYPRTGDVIFWDNTWDANGDGNRTNDPRTHAGIVLAVDDDGTIHYVHEHLREGVKIEVMNLLTPGVAADPTGKRLNNSMAIATVSGGPKPARYLSGDVFQAFGDALKVKGYYEAAGGPRRTRTAYLPTL